MEATVVYSRTAIYLTMLTICISGVASLSYYTGYCSIPGSFRKSWVVSYWLGIVVYWVVSLYPVCFPY